MATLFKKIMQFAIVAENANKVMETYAYKYGTGPLDKSFSFLLTPKCQPVC
jgi:hypothetical protein